MNNFLITIIYLILGIFARKWFRFPEQTGNILNLFVIYISLPALILLKIPELTFSNDIIIPAVVPWIMLAISAAAVKMLSNFMHWDRKVTGALLLLIPLGNTSFLGIPMVEAFFGNKAVPYAVLYDQIGSFFSHWQHMEL